SAANLSTARWAEQPPFGQHSSAGRASSHIDNSVPMHMTKTEVSGNVPCSDFTPSGVISLAPVCAPPASVAISDGDGDKTSGNPIALGKELGKVKIRDQQDGFGSA